MTDVAVISVISSGIVGVLGAMAGFYGQRVTLRNEDAKRRELRRDHLRDALADAATVAMGVFPRERRFDDPLGEMAPTLDNLSAAMQIQLARIAILLGPRSDAFDTYQTIITKTQGFEGALRKAPPSMTWEQIGTAKHEYEKTMLDAGQELSVALGNFLTAAAAVMHADP